MLFLSVILISFSQVSFAQKESELAHSGAWTGTGQLCNVCHEPYNAKYAIKQIPYWNHQVNAPTFRGNKLDGSPVLIKQGNNSDKCLNCHNTKEERAYISKEFTETDLDNWHK